MKLETAIDVVLAVAEIGGKLAIADRNRLRTLLPAGCSPELKDAIRKNKAGLLALLAGPPFAVVRSDLLPGELLLWTADEEGRELLVAQGAPPGRIYNRDELATLVRQQPDPDTLRKLHAAKRTFNGRLKGSPEQGRAYG